MPRAEAPLISAGELSALLHRIAGREVAFSFLTDQRLGAGAQISIAALRWQIVFVCDASGGLDHVEYAVSPDGRKSRYKDWVAVDPDGWRDPLQHLSAEQQGELELMMEE